MRVSACPGSVTLMVSEGTRDVAPVVLDYAILGEQRLVSFNNISVRATELTVAGGKVTL